MRAHSTAWERSNVALHIRNTFAIYRRALELMQQGMAPANAARTLKQELPARTPDGVLYTYVAIVAALEGILK